MPVARLVGVSIVVALCGCATSAPDSSQFAQIDEFVVDAAFDETWLRVRDALLERELTIYTRDKRGIFVAYTEPKRPLIVPHRTQVTVNISEVTPDSTRVTIETLDQEYGVTLLTYPGWHAQPTEETPETDALVALIQGKEPLEEGPMDEGAPEAELSS